MKILEGYIGGMTWGWDGTRGIWNNDTAEHSMKEMAAQNDDYCPYAKQAESIISEFYASKITKPQEVLL
ncbi:hypothetical protein J2T13_003390 [Paenibacillus sp. DS2015]|uniref:hypothetical protein n=1 Tax=Paenibacillus sp. DS2015 TaxID=3373917 RepID=UPI003D1E9961